MNDSLVGLNPGELKDRLPQGLNNLKVPKKIPEIPKVPDVPKMPVALPKNLDLPNVP